MPDEFTISQLPTSTSFNNLDLMEIAQVDENSVTGYTSYKKTMNQIGDKINNSIEYSADLLTTNKKVLGAINEVNAKVVSTSLSGGGSITIACGFGALVFMSAQSVSHNAVYMIDGTGAICPIIETHQDLSLSYTSGVLTISNTTASSRQVTVIKP